MGFLSALPAIGMGISGIADLFGGSQQANAQKQQAGAAQAMMGQGSGLEALIQSILSQTGTPNFNAQNRSNDPLMQALKASSGGVAAQKSNDTYSGIIDAKGSPFDLTSLFQTLQAQNKMTQTAGVAGINANAGSFGRRYGSSNSMGVGNYLAQTDTNFAAQKAQIAQSSSDAAMQRVLAAAQGLGANANAQEGTMLGAAQVGQQGAGQQASYISSLLSILSGTTNSRLNRNASLLGVANPTGPNPLTGAVGSAGDTLSLLPMLLQLLGGGK